MMRRSWSDHARRSLLVSFALGFSLAATAHAADVASSHNAERDALVRQGLALRRDRQDAAALESFRRAFAVAPSAMIQAQVALAEQALGRWLEAERDLEAALRQPDTWVESNRRVLTRALAVIQSHLGWLEVSTSRPASELWLDGERMATLDGSRAESPRRVTAGRHRLALVAPDGRRLEQAFEIQPGSVYSYHAEWPNWAVPPSSSSPAPAPAHAPAPASNRKHRAAAPAPLSKVHATHSSSQRTLAYVSAAVAVVALGEAIAASLLRLDYVEHYNGPDCYPQRSTQCAAYRDVANTLGTAAVIGYALAGTAALGSVTLFVWPERSNPASSAGLSFSGKF